MIFIKIQEILPNKPVQLFVKEVHIIKFVLVKFFTGQTIISRKYEEVFTLSYLQG